MTRLIVEADGGSRGNPGPAAFGALVRSAESGEVLAEVGEPIGVATNNVAEYRGLIAGLQLAAELDPQAEVEVRLDSKLVVEQMSGRWKIKHADLRPLALEAERIFPPGRVSYTWVPRERNAHADRLLNEALDGKSVKTTKQTQRTAERRQDPGPPTTLFLVRHGRTAMTHARQFSGGGVVGPELDDVGREQASRAAGQLAGLELLAAARPAVIASPMRRTRQTAEILADRLGAGDVVVEEQWRECDFGEWDGLTLAEVTERFPDESVQYFASTSFASPGGESLDDMTARIAAARADTVKRYPGQAVVVVTHSMPIRALVRLTLDAPPSAMFRLQPAPGSVTRIEHFDDGGLALTGFNHRT